MRQVKTTIDISTNQLFILFFLAFQIARFIQKYLFIHVLPIYCNLLSYSSAYFSISANFVSSALITLAVGIFTLIAFPLAIYFCPLFDGGF